MALGYSLQVDNVIRGDTGMYRIVLKNPSGEASAQAMVTVVSKPTPPRGPMEVKDVCKDGALVSWEAPEDDGGEPIEGR